MRNAVPTRSAARRARARRGVAGAVAVLTALLGVQSLTAAPASAAVLSCSPNTLFGISGSNLSSIDVTTGAVTQITTMPDASNGLGVSVGGSSAYAYSSASNNTLDVYDGATNTVSTVPNLDPAGVDAIRGAVDPRTGVFYYGSGNVTANGITTISVGAYDPAAGVKLGKVATITSHASGSGGDFAFGRDGTMFVLIGMSVERVDQLPPGTSGNAALTTTPLATISATSPGLAFAANGYLYANSGTSLYQINPITGAVVGGATMSGRFSPSDLASCTYANSMTASVQATERVHPTDQFTATITGGGLSRGNTGTTTGSDTAAHVLAGPVLGLGGDSYTVTQTMPSGDPAGYTSHSICTADGATIASGDATSASASVPFTVPTGSGAIVSCVFTNTPKTAVVGLAVGLGGPRADAADQFVASVQQSGTALGTGTATTGGTGAAVTPGTGTTGAATLVAGRSTDLGVAMSGGSASRFGQYGARITCTDSSGLQTGLPTGAAFSGSLTITPVPGAIITCTVTATAAAPTLTVLADLDGARADDGDQFTVGLRDGDASGTTLGSATTGTTAGTGATVTAGSGTTGSVTLDPAQTVAITGAATAHPGAYRSTLTCTDANGFQPSAPSGAAFDGSRTIAPVAGAALTCRVRSVIRGTTLSVVAGLGSARFDDGDQVAVAVRVGGPSGTVAGQGPAGTTSGTGSSVTPGTGTTGDVPVTPGTAYAVTAGTSGHDDRYTQTITCTDANGLQTGLPSHAAFTGSLQVTPVAGAAIGCSVETTLVPASIASIVTGPAVVDVGATGTWQVTVTNDGGAPASPTVAVRLPAGLAYARTTGTGWQCAPSGSADTGQLLTCTGPVLRGGASDVFTVEATPLPKADDTTLVVPVAADPDGGTAPVDPATCTGAGTPTAGCAAPVSIAVGAPVRLRLDAVGPSALTVGAPASYRISVGDTGAGPAGSATVAVRLPAGTAFLDATGAACTTVGRLATCTLPGPIGAGATSSFTVRLTPSPAAAGTVAVLRAALDPTGAGAVVDPDSCSTDDAIAGCAVVSAPVAAGISLALRLDAPATVTPGSRATLVATVTNGGTAAARDVTVAVRLPAGLVLVSAAGATCETGEPLRCVLTAPVAASGRTSFSLVVMPGDPLADPVRVRGAVGPSGDVPADPAACEATDAPSGCAVATSRTAEAAALRLDATAVPLGRASGRVVAGDRLAFRWTVTNEGDSAVQRLVITAAGVGPISCAAGTLAPGASTTCTALPYTVTQADVDAGSVARDAVATAAKASCTTPSCTTVTSNRAATRTPAKVIARIGADQSVKIDDANRDGVANAGETARFTVVLTNTGTVTLHDLRLSDATLHLDCPSTDLAVGATMRCTGSRTVTDADVAAGRIRSAAFATAAGSASLGRVSASSERVVATVPTRIGQRLATTGSTLVPTLAGGAGLLLVGVALLLGTRRRRRA